MQNICLGRYDVAMEGPRQRSYLRQGPKGAKIQISADLAASFGRMWLGVERPNSSADMVERVDCLWKKYRRRKGSKLATVLNARCFNLLRRMGRLMACLFGNLHGTLCGDCEPPGCLDARIDLVECPIIQVIKKYESL